MFRLPRLPRWPRAKRGGAKHRKAISRPAGGKVRKPVLQSSLSKCGESDFPYVVATCLLSAVRRLFTRVASPLVTARNNILAIE